jgi:superfamily I DNA and/or RNA helicase
VHRFQGHERDLIIFDTVDAPPLSPGVLLNRTGPDSAAANLLNVSLSRARGKLIILAAVDYFQEHAPTSLVNLLLEQAAARGQRFPMDLDAASR